jgi:hypothetical protein
MTLMAESVMPQVDDALAGESTSPAPVGAEA